MTVALSIHQSQEGGTNEDLARNKVQPKLAAVHLEFIDKCMQDDNETTGSVFAYVYDYGGHTIKDQAVLPHAGIFSHSQC